MPTADWYDSDDPDVDECDDDSEDTVVCPECGADVYEDAGRCPVCGLYLTPDTSPWSNRSGIWIVISLLGIVAVIAVLILGSLAGR